jgi:hypothetical protein
VTVLSHPIRFLSAIPNPLCKKLKHYECDISDTHRALRFMQTVHRIAPTIPPMTAMLPIVIHITEKTILDEPENNPKLMLLNCYIFVFHSDHCQHGPTCIYAVRDEKLV